MNWTTADIPPQAGRIAVVTGTGGLGYETALALARAGAEVILAGRNPAKGTASIARISAAVPGVPVRFEALDLASLESIAAFAARMRAQEGRIDLLINNAGVMNLPERHVTADGFEMQFGTNYLGHFALTMQLLPLLRASDLPRLVNLSSLYHRAGRLDFDDLQGERLYQPTKAYAQSKLAMLMFAIELQRRADTTGWNLRTNAAHPGYARTDLISNGPGARGLTHWLNKWLLQPWASHSAAAGALPTLFAATAPEARGAAYYGPAGFYELKGPPAQAKIAEQALDAGKAALLWHVSERLTGQALTLRSTYEAASPVSDSF